MAKQLNSIEKIKWLEAEIDNLQRSPIVDDAHARQVMRAIRNKQDMINEIKAQQGGSEK